MFDHALHLFPRFQLWSDNKKSTKQEFFYISFQGQQKQINSIIIFKPPFFLIYILVETNHSKQIHIEIPTLDMRSRVE